MKASKCWLTLTTDQAFHRELTGSVVRGNQHTGKWRVARDAGEFGLHYAIGRRDCIRLVVFGHPNRLSSLFGRGTQGCLRQRATIIHPCARHDASGETMPKGPSNTRPAAPTRPA